MATAFNGDSAAPVNANASDATVSFTTRATGASVNFSLTTGSTTSQGTCFSHPSFAGSPSGAALTGGQDAGAPVNDTGTVTITVNGFTKSASYGSTSTASSVASALGNAFSGDTSSPVNASVSGGTITFAAKTGGATTNFVLSASSATNQSGFTGTSFPASASGANLTGGADSTQSPTTPYSVALTFMPNGNVATANDNVNGNWTYGYDDFNRLASSSKTGSSYTYAYDRYGNRWQQNLISGTGNVSSLTFMGGNNRTDGNSYDAAGNMLNDGLGHTFTYDAENRIIAVGSNVTYAYDGAGRRIRKTVSGTSTDFLYDLSSHIVAEMNLSGAWTRGEVFASGRHVATYANGTTYFAHADWLGTERARTQLNGQVCETTTSLPFGDGTATTGTCYPSPNLFTGKERDAETGLDYFGSRYYASGLGRFVSADKMFAAPYRMFTPQGLNLYAYVVDNPLRFIDPNGYAPISPDLLSRINDLRAVSTVEALDRIANYRAGHTKGASFQLREAAEAQANLEQKGNLQGLIDPQGQYDRALSALTATVEPGIQQILEDAVRAWAINSTTTLEEAKAAILDIAIADDQLDLPNPSLSYERWRELLQNIKDKGIDEATDHLFPGASIAKKAGSTVITAVDVDHRLRRRAIIIILIAQPQPHVTHTITPCGGKGQPKCG